MMGSSDEQGKAGKDDPEYNGKVVELSDIAVGISSEDEEIIDLTEEIVVGAFEGYSGIRGDIDPEEVILDLSRIEEASWNPEQNSARGSESTDSAAVFTEGIEKRLENYFLAEEETEELPIASDRNAVQDNDEPDLEIESEEVLNGLPFDQVESALENVIRKMFAEKIGNILDEKIEGLVNEEIELLRRFVESRK